MESNLTVRLAATTPTPDRLESQDHIMERYYHEHDMVAEFARLARREIKAGNPLPERFAIEALPRD